MSLVYSTLLDAVGCRVTVETLDGTTYSGKLDNVDKVGMGLRLSTALVTLPNGMKDASLSVTIPGSNQKLVRLPDQMKNAARFTDVRRGAGTVGAASAKKKKHHNNSDDFFGDGDGGANNNNKKKPKRKSKNNNNSKKKGDGAPDKSNKKKKPFAGQSTKKAKKA